MGFLHVLPHKYLSVLLHRYSIFFLPKKDYSKLPINYDKFILQSAMIEQSSALLAELSFLCQIFKHTSSYICVYYCYMWFFLVLIFCHRHTNMISVFPCDNGTGTNMEYHRPSL